MSFGHYGPTLLAMLRAIRHMPTAFRKHGMLGPEYAALDRPMTGTVDVHDAALNLFLRAIMEFRYRSVIEIGAYDGARIIVLKRLAPEIEAFGLDILPQYNTPFERGGVKFRRFDPAFFAGIPTPALFCSRGTLPYFQPAEVAELFNALSARGVDIAIYEPVAYRNVPRSLKRSPNSFYHPYDHLLRQAGLTPCAEFNGVTGFSFSLSMMEAWYGSVARAPKALA